MDGYMGQVILFAGTFAPREWAFCNGTLLPIDKNTALFSILGATYGGDGRKTFALPNLCGRIAVGAGRGETGEYFLGAMYGSETASLDSSQLPHHVHTFSPQASAGNGTTKNPGGYLASAADGSKVYAASSNNNVMGTQPTSVAGGGSAPFSVVQPVLALNYIICISGVFPAKS